MKIVSLVKRRLGLVVAVAVAATLALAVSAPIARGVLASGPTALSAQNALEAPLLAEINKVRRAHGLDPLAASAELAEAADAHAVSMGQGGFFSHESADGTVFWKRVKQSYGSDGYWRWTVGENLLWDTNTTPAKAVQKWMDSPPHRRVLLGEHWDEVGLAAVRVTDAPGVFGGADATIVAADFGARSQ